MEKSEALKYPKVQKGTKSIRIISSDLPKVTVVTVVLNDPEGLKQTFKSIGEQTYENLEYIVIDGGSRAETLEVIHENLDKIDIWLSEPDRGIYDAMNKGI